MYRSILSLLALAATVSADTLSIDVGEDGGLSFEPNSMTAAVGDVLEFRFYSGSGGHSVVRSSFDSPCVPSADTFFSGYIPGDSSGDTVFLVNVTSTDPIWFYCSLDHHCQAGMVGVVNPPAGQSISDYMSAAQKATKGSAPASLEGGVITTAAEDSDGDSSSTAAGSAATSSSPEATSTALSSSMAAVSASSTASVASVSSSKASVASSAASATSSLASATSSASPSSTAATATGSGAGPNSERSTVLGLVVLVGGLVMLMA